MARRQGVDNGIVDGIGVFDIRKTAINQGLINLDDIRVGISFRKEAIDSIDKALFLQGFIFMQ
jgi:hypothetical protein